VYILHIYALSILCMQLKN